MWACYRPINPMVLRPGSRFVMNCAVAMPSLRPLYHTRIQLVSSFFDGPAEPGDWDLLPIYGTKVAYRSGKGPSRSPY